MFFKRLQPYLNYNSFKRGVNNIDRVLLGIRKVHDIYKEVGLGPVERATNKIIGRNEVHKKIRYESGGKRTISAVDTHKSTGLFNNFSEEQRVIDIGNRMNSK